MLRKIAIPFVSALCAAALSTSAMPETVFPGAQWARESPAEIVAAPEEASAKVSGVLLDEQGSE